MLHVLRDGRLADRLLDLALRLDVVRVRVQPLDLAVCADVPVTRLEQELSESRGVGSDGGGELGLGLWMGKGDEEVGVRWG